MNDYLEKYSPKTSLFAHFTVDPALPLNEKAHATWRSLLEAKRGHDGLFLVIGKLLKDVIKYKSCLRVSIYEQSQTGKREKSSQKCLGKTIPDGTRAVKNVLTAVTLFLKLHIQPKDVSHVLVNIKGGNYLVFGKGESQTAPFVARSFRTIMLNFVGTVGQKLDQNPVLKAFLIKLGRVQNILNGEKKFLKKIITSVENVVVKRNLKLITLSPSLFLLSIRKIIYFLRLVMVGFYAMIATLKQPIMGEKAYELS